MKVNLIVGVVSVVLRVTCLTDSPPPAPAPTPHRAPVGRPRGSARRQPHTPQVTRRHPSSDTLQRFMPRQQRGAPICLQRSLCALSNHRRPPAQRSLLTDAQLHRAHFLLTQHKQAWLCERTVYMHKHTCTHKTKYTSTCELALPHTPVVWLTRGSS